jgi:hypothetical protein
MRTLIVQKLASLMIALVCLFSTSRINAQSTWDTVVDGGHLVTSGYIATGDPNTVVFSLTIAPTITWWKKIVIKKMLNGQWYEIAQIAAQDNNKHNEQTFNIADLGEAVTVEYWHAGFLGTGALLKSYWSYPQNIAGQKWDVQWQRD